VNLLITDLDLPPQEALAVVLSLRAEYADLKIILLSGCWSRDTGDAYQAHGALALLPKPFRTEVMLQSVRNALGAKRGVAS